MHDGSKTTVNLQIALAGEADASRRYTAYGIRALQEGYPEVAQLFFEAAGAETVHAYSHLEALNAIGTTEENLRRATQGETGEIERMYPRMIADAEAEGVQNAASSFHLALQREKHHQQMFQGALLALQKRQARGAADGAAQQHAPTPGTVTAEKPASPVPTEMKTREATEETQGAHLTLSGSVAGDRAAAKRALKDIEGERERVARLAGIREVVFGGQDGLISTATLVAGMAATTSQSTVVLVAGAIAAVAGALSMAVGSYMSSRAQRQVYESELANERQEIAEKPGEELAELLAALTGRGLARRDAIEVVRRIGRHPKLMLDMLGIFELGLPPEGLGSPLRDAGLMAIAFVVGATIPLAPFLVLGMQAGLLTAMTLALLALFALGVVKARLSARSMLASGLEVMLLGGSAGLVGYLLGRAVSTVFGIQI